MLEYLQISCFQSDEKIVPSQRALHPAQPHAVVQYLCDFHVQTNSLVWRQMCNKKSSLGLSEQRVSAPKRNKTPKSTCKLVDDQYPQQRHVFGDLISTTHWLSTNNRQVDSRSCRALLCWWDRKPDKCFKPVRSQNPSAMARAKNNVQVRLSSERSVTNAGGAFRSGRLPKGLWIVAERYVWVHNWSGCLYPHSAVPAVWKSHNSAVQPKAGELQQYSKQPYLMKIRERKRRQSNQ